MRVLIRTGGGTFETRDMPPPIAGPDQPQVRVYASGLCETDQAYLDHDDQCCAPLTWGCEAAGVVESTGRRIVINPLVTCGVCDVCKRGRDNLCPDRTTILVPSYDCIFTPFVAMADANLVTVPEHVSFGKSALTEPLARGWHTVRLAEQAVTVHWTKPAVRSLVVARLALAQHLHCVHLVRSTSL